MNRNFKLRFLHSSSSSSFVHSGKDEVKESLVLHYYSQFVGQSSQDWPGDTYLTIQTMCLTEHHCFTSF